jgi:hypothetical protein
VTIRELLEYAQTNVKEWLLDSVIWDLTEVTIFVAPDLFSFGMLRMSVMIVEVVESSSVASVFTNMEEALALFAGNSES